MITWSLIISLIKRLFLSKFPIIENTSDYILLGRLDKCAEVEKVDRTFLEKLKENLNITYTNCEIFLSKSVCDLFG